MGVRIMSKTFWLVLGIIVVILLLFLGYLLFYADKTAGDKVKTNYTLKEAVAVISERDFEIQSLNNRISTLNGQITEKDQQIADLIKTCTGKTVYLKAKTPASSGSGNANSANGLKSANISRSTGNTEQDAEYLLKTNSVPKSKVTIEINEVKFCVRLGKFYWPHLAVLELKEEFPEIVANDDKGYDLFILPFGTIGSTGKDYGIAEDGTYWIKKSRLTHWPENPYFINKNGDWLTGVEEGEYWVAK